MSKTNASGLAGMIIGRYDSRDPLDIAKRAGLRVEFGRWAPVTAGELDHAARTIVVNLNAGVPPDRVVAHELGHFFLRRAGVTNHQCEERFCEEFAEALIAASKNCE